MTGDCFALKDDELYCNEHHKLVGDKLDSSDGGENNNNIKNIHNNNRELSEDGDDKSEEGKDQTLFPVTINIPSIVTTPEIV